MDVWPIDRADKQARICCVMNDRNSNNLLVIKKKVFTLDTVEDDDFKTRIYSVCYQSYQVSDFYELVFILKKVNYSKLFGKGLFYTNIVDGILSQIKRISHDF